jgi:hypothetical protein
VARVRKEGVRAWSMISCGTRGRSHRNPSTVMFSWLRTVVDSYGQLLVLVTVEAGLDLHHLRSCPTFKDGGRLERGASNSDRGVTSHPAQFVRWLSGLDANLGCQGGDHPCNAGRYSAWVKNAEECTDLCSLESILVAMCF